MILKKGTIIPVHDLQVDAWYLGLGRSGHLGRWNGESFAVLTDVMIYEGSVKNPKTREGIKYEQHFACETGSFQPFIQIKKPKITEPYSCDEIGYAKEIEIEI